MILQAIGLATALAAAPEAPPALSYTDEECARLDAGEAVSREEPWQERTGIVAAILIDAPAEVVWRQVIDYDAYVQFMPYVTASSTDKVIAANDHTDIDCSMELTTKGFVTRYDVRNHWYPDEGFMQFELLPSHAGPLKHADGYWRVEPWQKDPSRTMLAYRLDVELPWYVPAFAWDMASNRLPRVVHLLAKRAEADARGERD